MTRIDPTPTTTTRFGAAPAVPRRRLAAYLLATAAGLGAAACGDASDPSGPGDGGTPPAAVATVHVDPPAANLAANDTVRLRATPRSAAGAPLTGRTVGWTTTNPLVATVSTTGLVTATGPGTVTIRATSEGRIGEATLAVAEAPVHIHALMPATVQAGGVGFDLTVGGAGFVPGAVVRWDEQALPTTFVSATELRAYVPAPAIEQAGDVRVQVRNPAPSSGRAETTFKVVAPPPPPPAIRWVLVTPTDTVVYISPATGIYGIVQMRVRLLDENGIELTDRHVTWESQDPSIASVDQTGMVIGRRVGSVRIRAGSEGRFGGAGIDVRIHD